MSWLWHFWTVVLLFHQYVRTSSSSASSSSSFTADLFENWSQEHGKTYSSEQEKQYRIRVFEDNYHYITQHNNKADSTYILSLNAFGDLTHQEFKAKYLGRLFTSPNNNPIRGSSVFGTSDFDVVHVDDDGDRIPSSIDWRKKGAVARVKDQGDCGGCWAFSATGAIEGINKIVSGSLVSLSEQELIDCDRSYNSGCDGGLMENAYEFVVKNKGIDTDKDYPFNARDGTCINRDKLKRHVVTIDGYRNVPRNNETALMEAVAAQPVSVGICGSDRAFQFYSWGIFRGPCCYDLDHAMLIVGFDGSMPGVEYWIVKNSWGTSWGINGYMHLARRYGNSGGLCGINKLASYPVKTTRAIIPPAPPPSPPPPQLLPPSDLGLVKRDPMAYCNDDESCCCINEVWGYCFGWRCCEIKHAMFCHDGDHCCPLELPICDIPNKLCRANDGNTTSIKQQLKNAGLSR